MQLYTINATSWRDNEDDSYNNAVFDIMPEVVSRILSDWGIDGFTIYPVIGYWQGKQEKSYRIELAIDDPTTVTITGISEALRDYYNQDAVIITYPDNSVQFIER